jgi:predicted glycogen debranching enzyme
VIAFGADIVRSFADASEKEWLETNGRGSYAMGTVAGGASRRYHGLLVAAARPPVGRTHVLGGVEDGVIVGEERVALSTQPTVDDPAPAPCVCLQEFRLDPFPTWIFEVNGTRLKKSFFLRFGEDTAVVLYEHVSGPSVELDVRPLVTGRHHHFSPCEDGRFEARWTSDAGGFSAFPAGSELPIHARILVGEFRSDPAVRRDRLYAWERRRGLDDMENVFSPGVFRAPLVPGAATAVVFSTEKREADAAFLWAEQERRLRRELAAKTRVSGPLGRTLTEAADQFLVARGDGMSVIAGYPWFEDWGRDAMISLPGLCLATGRPEDAERVLDTWVKASSDGRTPNRFPDDGSAPDVFAVDAGLWLVWAVQCYFRSTRDLDALRRWAPTLRRIVDVIEKGDRRGVHMDRDGLVSLPDEAAAFTWMDARVDGVAVTPRPGKPVEIQALWYNALEFLAETDIKLKDGARGYDKLAAIARISFNEKFWNERESTLYDRLDGRDKIAEVRPNAVLAMALPYEILDAGRFRAVVDRAERDLLTPFGLRTLSPSDPAYQGRFEGGPAARDRAYHQGAVWPWLLGPFVTAYSKAHGSSEATKARLAEFLKPFRDHVMDAGLSSVSEVFDGDAPHRPGGCPAQAWSVAEILRVLWEENIPL